MPIQTDLSVSPYWDDFNATKNYHQVLFKPGVALQTRELNALQSILQNQIEVFGDNIFNTGTIISGCNFQYFNNYPYAKIIDTQVNGQPVTMGNYVGNFAVNSANLIGYILASNSGYVSQAPNLNTLFIRYINSGNTSAAAAFSQNDVLTIYDANNSIFSVTVPVGGSGSGIANSDSVVFMPAMTLSTNSGPIVVGSQICNPATFANAVVVSVNTTYSANQVLLGVRPSTNALTNNSFTSTSWTFFVNDSVNIVYANGAANATGTVGLVIGSGANALIQTDSTGKILLVSMNTQGTGYNIAPYTTVKVASNTANISALIGTTSSLTALNYQAQVTVANNTAAGSSNAVGTGYAFGVSEGYIFQKGYFLYVPAQTIVVSPYSNTPDQLSVGFSTAEAIINSNIDPTLLDNVTGTNNTLAPGADRLQLNPTLSVINASSATGNSSFFPITSFSQGNPYLQNQQTIYSTIGDSIATRSYETSGNYVTAPFQITTVVAPLDSVSNASTQSNVYTVAIGPGEAYVYGYRTKSSTNFYATANQGTDTITSNVALNVNYGNYLFLQEQGGVFNYQLGDFVTFYDTAKTFLSNTVALTAGNTTPVGNAIGTARIRSMVPVGSGTPGTPAYQSRLYLFDVNMYPGKNISAARSVYYSNTFSGIGDIVLTYNAQLGANVAMISNTTGSQMIFAAGVTATKSTANSSYVWKGLFTGANGVTVNSTNGTITVDLGTALGAGFSFPFTANAVLSQPQLAQIGVVFHSSNSGSVANIPGISFTSNTTNMLTIATGTTAVLVSANVVPGDYLKVYSNSISTEFRRLTGIVNSSVITIDSVLAVAVANTTGANIAVAFPQNVPVALTGRAIATQDRFANVSSNGTFLTITLGQNLVSTSNATVLVPVQAINRTAGSKSPRRDNTVVLNLTNAASSNSGPWPLGVPDIFRLKKVYKDTNTNIIPSGTVITANVTSGAGVPSTWIDVTNQFYIDHRQNPDFYDMGYLFKKPSSTLTLATSDALVVQFDDFTGSGFFTRSSYTTSDATPYANLSSGTNIHTLEIPEMVDSQGNYYDLIDQVDFRPRVMATANTNTFGNTALSTVNPVDWGALPVTVIAGTANATAPNVWITAISSNTLANTIVGMPVYLANATTVGLPVLAGNVVSVNSTVIVLSATPTVNGVSTVTITGELIKFGGSLTSTAYPIDGQTYSSTITNYLGRIDRVVLDNTTKFNVVRGQPAAVNPTAPAEPAMSMTLDLLSVPPYPSIPLVKDANYTALLDKGMYNIQSLFQRASNYGISIIQPQNMSYQTPTYTMADIQHLDRRITALESQSSLTALENSLLNLAIPSSISQTINRFKYGYFADTFANTLFSDIKNPAYSATISAANEVIPLTVSNNIEFKFNSANATTAAATTGQLLTLPYASTYLVQQAVATVSTTNTAVATPPPPTTYYGTMTSNPPTFTLTSKVSIVAGWSDNYYWGSGFSTPASPVLNYTPITLT